MPATLAPLNVARLVSQEVQLLRIWHVRLLRNWSQIKSAHQDNLGGERVRAAELNSLIDALAQRRIFVLGVLNPPDGFPWPRDSAWRC